jgi:hypothetical protein
VRERRRPSNGTKAGLGHSPHLTFYDAWLPEVAPGEPLVKVALRAGREPARWRGRVAGPAGTPPARLQAGDARIEPALGLEPSTC